MNGQSRDTGNIGYNKTRDEDKSINKKHNTTQKTKKDEEHSPYQKPV